MVQQLPGIGTTKSAAPRKILATMEGALYLPGGKIISGAKSRDPAQPTADITTLRAGMVMGKRVNDGKYAPSILGALTVAGTAAGATITVPAAVGTELDRRIGAGGIFYVVGPPTDGGVVAIANALSYSGQVAGVITLAVNGAVAEVQTYTCAMVADGGTYTLTYKGETTAAIAWNGNAAAINAALLLLATVNAGDITASAALVTGTTFTFANTLGDVPLITIDATLLTDGGLTMKDDVAIAETTPGEIAGAATLGVDMALGSLLMPLQTLEPLTLLMNEYGVKVTDSDNLDIDVQFAKLLVGGIINSKNIIGYPTLGTLRTWLKAQLNANGGHFVFDDNY